MSQENKEIVRRWFEAVSRHDIDAAVDLVVDDFVNNNSTSQGKEGVREELEFWYAAFPDLAISVEDLVAEDDKVVARLTATATHQGDFMGLAATGRKITVQEFDMARIENGLIAEVWAIPDMIGMLTQLGVAPLGEPVG